MKQQSQLSCINQNAAGIDIGSKSHFVAVPPDRAEKHVREFSSFTSGLEEIVTWLKECKIETVAMESTSVFWIPLYETLESNGFEVYLVDARKIKNVPGRKTDVKDSEWIQQLHTFGLLHAAFRPNQEICELRSYLRHRANLIEQGAQQINLIQKSLDLMNIKIHNVVSQITGKTGMTILRSIIDGERNPEKLAAHRTAQCKASTELFVESLKGQYRAEHIFSLKQAVSIYDTYQDKILECDQEIEKLLEKHKKKKSDDNDDKQEPYSKKKKSNSKNSFEFNLGELLMDMTGVDLTRIDGISPNNALTIIAEIGLNMNCWKNEKHFSSWLDLSPGNRKSGGKQISGKTRKNANRAAKAFRLAAMTLYKSQSSLGAYFRRMRSKKGSPKAITAAAHKIAKLFYSVLKYGKEYLDKGMEHYEKQFEAKRLKFLEKQARQFGHTLTLVGV